jgi:hypothetical protein
MESPAAPAYAQGYGSAGLYPRYGVLPFDADHVEKDLFCEPGPDNFVRKSAIMMGSAILWRSLVLLGAAAVCALAYVHFFPRDEEPQGAARFFRKHSGTSIASGESDHIVLRKPTPVRLKYGSAILPAGMSLRIVSKNADALVVDYAGENVTLPTH